MALNGDQIERYSRQILVPEIGGRGQNKLLACRVRCLGTSPTLTTAADYLAAAGLTVSNDSDADLLLATADEPTGDAGTVPAFFAGETAGGAVWYSRRTAADACRDCLHEAAAAIAGDGNAGSRVATAQVAGAALAADVIAQVIEMTIGDAPSVVVFSRGGRQRRLGLAAANSCVHRTPAEAPAANQPAAYPAQP